MKNPARLLAFGPLLVALVLSPLATAARFGPSPGVDLGIADDPVLGRPFIRVAWRNSKEILEVEVHIRNRGDQEGQGRLHLEILDDRGKLLVRAPAPGLEVPVTVPPNQEGNIGEPCRFTIPGSRELNHLFDQLDRMGRAYYMRAVVETEGSELNPQDNVATKSYNRDFRATPGVQNLHQFHLDNPSNESLTLQWSVILDSKGDGWEITTSPQSGELTTIAARDALEGQASFWLPRDAPEGVRANYRVRAVSPSDGSLVFEDEWFLINDFTPPTIVEQRAKARGHTIDVGVVASDLVSGVKEASGVSVDYSTDTGVTYSTRIAQYLDGNFIDPTSFKAELGPFEAGTTVLMSLAVTDTAGNVSRTPQFEVSVPSGA